LLAGDPIERTVAADALGRAAAQYAPAYRPRIAGLLQDAHDHDPYPAVRAIAARSLQALRARGAVTPTAPDPALAAALRARAAQTAIEIGE
jgi:hypothetical protein